jgi:hypothetical protein
MAREKCGLLAVPRAVPGSRDVLPYTAHVRRSVYSPLKCIHAVTAHVKCLEPKGQLRHKYECLCSLIEWLYVTHMLIRC